MTTFGPAENVAVLASATWPSGNPKATNADYNNVQNILGPNYEFRTLTGESWIENNKTYLAAIYQPIIT